jgi:hypothetical protein
MLADSGDTNSVSIVVCTTSDQDFYGFVQQNRRELKHFSEIVWVDQSALYSMSVAATEVEHLPVIAVQTPVFGFSNARNVGLSLSNATWCYFADDDQVILDRSVDSLRQFLTQVTEFEVVLGTWVEQSRSNKVRPASAFDIARSRSSIETVYRSSAIRSVGGFDQNLGAGSVFPAGEDVDALYRVLASGGRATYIDTFRVSHRVSNRRGARRLGQQRFAFEHGLGYGAFLAKSGCSILRILAAAIGLMAGRASSASSSERLAGSIGRVFGFLGHRALIRSVRN